PECAGRGVDAQQRRQLQLRCGQRRLPAPGAGCHHRRGANYTVTDEHGATSSSTLTITLTGTNDAPVAVADTNAGLEDSTITGSVATNDSDVDDGASLSYGLNAPVAGLTLNADGSYSF